MPKLLVLNDRNFKEVVIDSTVPALVDFWASWCPPCKMVEPLLEELSTQLQDAVTIGKINVDQNPHTADHYKIAGVPTFIVFDKGHEIARRVGAQSRQQLLGLFEAVGIVTGIDKR